MCLYIGDIGDNGKNADKLTIFRIKEPFVDHAWSNYQSKYTGDWSRFYLRYPNGQKYDAESMVIDASRHEIVVFTKSWSSYGCKVFKGKFIIKQDELQWWQLLFAKSFLYVAN